MTEGMFFLNGQFPASFLFIFVFSIQLTVAPWRLTTPWKAWLLPWKVYIKFVDDWIWTADLWVGSNWTITTAKLTEISNMDFRSINCVAKPSPEVHSLNPLIGNSDRTLSYCLGSQKTNIKKLQSLGLELYEIWEYTKAKRRNWNQELPIPNNIRQRKKIYRMYKALLHLQKQNTPSAWKNPSH